MKVNKIIMISAVLLLAVGCSSIEKTITPDIPLEQQHSMLKKYRNKKAWTRIVLEDIKGRGIAQRDTKVRIIDLDFHWNGTVTVMTMKRKKIVFALDLERPLTTKAIDDKLDEIFWFKSPLLRQVAYIRAWGKKTARAIRNHDVFIGMTGEAAMESWGIPDKINVNEIRGKKEEQWIYHLGKHSKYIYIIGDKVSKWED